MSSKTKRVIPRYDKKATKGLDAFLRKHKASELPFKYSKKGKHEKTNICA